ncbi:uncharacterized protein E5676_scaffold120G002560 [Cucumis melo var. makuwa]|uniref:Retrotransposon gag domain-containing protein n=1 Tax=Cucumis melo var. makuwa TaxID=1194695 RepID=A0A5A7UKH5_CUCMM|nr:uncharacterized protein E6C27_scaffold186G001520 [Cucumis melo var. makuwa]TYK29115.1 uncharacterized protein E5676_scaffold120G002560 [Cucumis melo var. makuwa]
MTEVEVEFPVPDRVPWSAEVSISIAKSTNTVEKRVVSRLHVVFRSKLAGVMPPRTTRRCRQNQDGMEAPTQGQSVGESSTPRVQVVAEKERFARTAHEIGRPERVEPNPADAEDWLNILEKCFDMMNCPEERKRDEFLGLKQGSLSETEYERKYTELSQYADVIVASKSDRCRRFERGLRFEIRTPVTTIAKWKDFSQLVETALRVEQSITEEKSVVELSR